MASQDSLASLSRGEEMQFFADLQAEGFNSVEIRKLIRNRRPQVGRADGRREGSLLEFNI